MALPDSMINRVFAGDCLDVLPRFGSEVFDLAYLDPPFNTGVVQQGSTGAFDDAFEDIASYVAFVRARVERIHEALKPTGVILLHCDWRACHHLRLMLDDVFGAENIVNHLIWVYGLGGSSGRRFARKHDDILFYAKSDAYYFKPPQVPATSRRMAGQMKKATDVIDVLRVPTINNMARERTGYPTQKPLELLSMLVKACCPPGGLVADPFCGSGTTLMAAAECGRRFVGVDVNPDAVKISRSRVRQSQQQAAKTDRPHEVSINE